MSANKKGPIVDPGKCRCCGMMKKCRLLNFEYESMGKREVYSEMFVDCFGLVLSHLDAEEAERLICATCVVRLRDACVFRQQVLQCEERLLTANVHIYEAKAISKSGLEMKTTQGGQQASDTTIPKEGFKREGGSASSSRPVASEPRSTEASSSAAGSPPRTVPEEHQDELGVPEDQETLTSLAKVALAVGEDNIIKLETVVKQEALTDSSPADNADHSGGEPTAADLSDDDDIQTGDADIGLIDLNTEKVPLKLKPKSKPVKVRQVKASRRVRKGLAGSSDTMKLHTSLQMDMLDKLQRMKEKLNKKAKKELKPPLKPVQTEIYQPKFKRPPVLDKEFNTLRNTITIIENSYVTPFTNMFSDYHCVYCREMFIVPEKLREHTLEHDPRTYQEFLNPRKMSLVDVTRIDCRLCQIQIDDIDTFKEHITTVHKKMIYKDVDTEFIKFKLKTGKLSCVECEKSFTYFQALKKHMAEHFGTYICDVCGAHYFEERHLVFHKKTHVSDRNIEMFPCTDCDKSFRSKNSRNFHIARIHRNEAAYPCNKCDEVFISYHMRYRHKITAHGEKREFPCENCDKVYDCRKTLREHHQRTHLQLLRHECTLCDKKFYLPSALRDHMTSHTGERLYRCDYCGKNYPRKKALKVHLQSHNTEKKYKCSLCPSSYTQANNFKNHMKSKHPVQPDYSEGYR